MSVNRRSAANFSRGQSQSSYYTVPKTRSENFIEYMRSTGCQVPTCLKPENVEFVIQDAELFECAKFCMGRAKYVLTNTEIERYQSITSNGTALDKTEVQQAIAESKEVNVGLARKRETLKQKRIELEAKIKAKKSQIQQWNHSNVFHEHIMNIKKTEDSRKNFEEENWSRKLKYLEQEFQNQNLQFREDVTATRSAIAEAINLCEKQKQDKDSRKQEQSRQDSLFLCQYNFNWIQSKENNLMALLRKTAENYGRIIGGSKEFDPFLEEKIAQEHEQYVKDIERLRHVIVFEYIQKAKLTSKIEKYTAIDSSMDGIFEHAQRIVSQSSSIQSKLLDEIYKRLEDGNSRRKPLKKKKLVELCEAKMGELILEIKDVKDDRKQAKKQEDIFFRIVNGKLLQQRLRHQICLDRIGQEIECICNIGELMKKFGDQLKYFQQIEQSLSPEHANQRIALLNPKLISAFRRNEIPLSVLSSKEATWKALVLINQKSEVDNMKKKAKEENQVELRIARLKESSQAAIEVWESFKRSNLTGTTPEELLIKTLSEDNNKIKLELRTYSDVNQKHIKEAIELKRLKCEDVKHFLKELHEKHPIFNV